MTMSMIARAKENLEQRTSAAEFVSLARLILAAKGSTSHARDLAEAEGFTRLTRILKTVGPGAIGGDAVESPASWGEHLGYDSLSAAFLASLIDTNVFDSMLPFARPVPVKSRVLASHIAANAAVVGEGSAKPVGTLELDDEALAPQKAVSTVVVSNDLVKLGGPLANALIDTELRRGVSRATDNAFVDTLVAGTTPISSGGEFLYDLGLLLDAVEGDGSSKYFLAVEPSILKRLAVMPSAFGSRAYPELGVRGGTVGGVTVVASDQLDSGKAVLFDATQIAADPGAVMLDASEHANIDMAGGNTPTLSLWQKNCRGLRAERRFGFKVLRTTAVASLSGATYAADSPS